MALCKKFPEPDTLQLVNIPYFIQRVPISNWHSDLNGSDLHDRICQATSVMQFLALTHATNDFDSHTLHIEAKSLCQAILFLSKNDSMEAVQVLVFILESLDNLKTSITLNLSLKTINLTVLSKDAFHTIVIIAISNMIRMFSKNDKCEPILLKIIKNLLSALNSMIISSLSIFHLGTLCALIKCTDIKGLEIDISYKMYLYLNSAPFKQAIKYADEILGLIMKRITTAEKLDLFRNINKLVWWGRGESVMVIFLIINWPFNLPLDYFIYDMTPRLAAMLLENITNYSMKVLRVIINHMSLETWHKRFIPNIITMISNHFHDEWELISKTLAQCVNLGVQRFDVQLFNGIKSDLLFTCYPALVLYYSIQKGCISIADHQNDIHRLLHSSDDTMQDFAVKALCTFNSKKSELNKWHITEIKFYLESTLFSSKDVCYKELSYFLSHLVVQANQLLQIGDDVCKLLGLTEFVEWLYNFSIVAISSRASRRIKVGSEMFRLVSYTISHNSHCLKTKYSLDQTDRYNEKESLLFEHLVKTGKWKYADRATYQLIINEFLSSEKVFPEICTLIEKSCVLDSGTAELLYQTACNLLEKHDKESIAKANYCISFIFATSSADIVIVDKIFNQWYILTAKLANNKFVDAQTIMAIYGYTVCICSLLNRNMVKQTQHVALLNACKQIVKELLAVNCSDHFLTVKNIEQTLVTIMDILCCLLKNIHERSLVNSCFELANEVIEQGSGKSVTSSAATAIRSICYNILESSDDTQPVITQYLEMVLFSIYAAPEIKTSKVRKNPEHRLIIHAIVDAEKNENRPYLVRSLNFILDVLSNSTSGSSAKAAALHTLEILICNSSIHNETFPYISLVATYAIEEFSSNVWNIKNASIQVLQAMINRLIGQKNCLTQRRFYGVDNLLILYPDLIIYCLKKLYGEITQENCDSVIAILALFSESHYTSYNIYFDENISFILGSFQSVFIHLITTNKNVGLFAAKAYAALYPLEYIPDIMFDVVEWLKQNFVTIDKNIFASVMCLLGELSNKFNLPQNNVFRTQTAEKVRLIVLDLELFLKQFNHTYEMSLFNLLAIQSNHLDELEEKVFVMIERTDIYENRIWLSNNLPKVLNNVAIELYPLFLQRLFDCELTFLPLKLCIRSIVNRYQDLVKYSLTNSVLASVIKKFIQIRNRCNYTIIIFCQTILLLLEGSYYYACDKKTLLQLRDICVNGDRNIYKHSLYVALLSYCIDFVEEDQVLMQEIILLYKDEALKSNVAVQSYLASTLVYLYNCAQISHRPLIFKISFILLLNPECALEVSTFFTFVFDLQFCNVYDVLVCLLSSDNLVKFLKSTELTAAFLIDLKIFVSLVGDEFEDCGMFYMKQNEGICCHKQFLLKTLQEQIEVVFKLLPQHVCDRMIEVERKFI